MQLQAVVDTAAQVTLVSEEFYKSLDPAPPIRKEVVMNTYSRLSPSPLTRPSGLLEFRGSSLTSLLFSSPTDSSHEDSYSRFSYRQYT
jgi:hypothetical protein